MKKSLFIIGLVITLFSCQEPKQLELGKAAIIPQVATLTEGEGHFEITNKTAVSVENEAQQKIATQFFKQFEKVSNWKPVVQVRGTGTIRFQTEQGLAEEAYELSVKKEEILIKSASGAGFFYALQTLKQLLAPAFYGDQVIESVAWGIPVVEIKDQPAFTWRGYMLDVSRHFFDKEQVKKVLDHMAELKLNRFHWHLADDQGWRLEIKAYPKLTEIGAWRMDYNTTDENVSNWFGRPKQKEGEKPTYGGFYTQEDVKEILAYAKERFIEVVPEIDMPGHAQATIAAYPEIGCVNAAPYVATGGVAKNNTYNPGKEETFVFAEKMLNEVMDLFPFNYVHIGGDECNKSQWKVDPHAQRRMKEEGLKDEHELQSYFIKRIEKIINARNKVMIGWDEILEGGLAPNAVVMSWRGEAGGITSVKANHEVIMTPNKYCYLDLKQGPDDFEPNLGYSRLLLSTSYNYQVIPEGLTEAQAKLIKGIQANMWTESISEWSKFTYMNFPRVYAVAENAWTSPQRKSWDGFSERLATQFKRLDAQKVRYAVSAYSPNIEHKVNGKSISISLKTEINNLDIRYTLDGSEPTIASNQYQQAFSLDKNTTVKAHAFKDGKAVGYTTSWTFPIHKAVGIEQNSAQATKLTDLKYARFTPVDTNWVRFNKGMEVDINLDQVMDVSKVSFNMIRFTISGIYFPKFIEVLGSEDGKSFKKLGELDQKTKSLIQGRNKIQAAISFPTSKVKVIRVKAKEVNPIPNNHHAAGQWAAIMVDEIVVE